MNASMLVQWLVIAAVVAWSVGYAFRRLLPVTSRRIAARTIGALGRDGAPAWLRRRVARLQPRASSGASCADGCSSCGGCAAPKAEPAAEAVPLVLRPRPKAH